MTDLSAIGPKDLIKSPLSAAMECRASNPTLQSDCPLVVNEPIAITLFAPDVRLKHWSHIRSS